MPVNFNNVSSIINNSGPSAPPSQFTTLHKQIKDDVAAHKDVDTISKDIALYDSALLSAAYAENGGNKLTVDQTNDLRLAASQELSDTKATDAELASGWADAVSQLNPGTTEYVPR